MSQKYCKKDKKGKYELPNEIFLKNGKSYYFNLYSKEINDNFFDTMEKFIKSKKLDNITIIREPIKYFHEKNYSENTHDFYYTG